MSDGMIEVYNQEEPEDGTTPPKQNVMCLELGDRAVFLEWGSVIAITSTMVRAVGFAEFHNIELHLRSGQNITIGPVTSTEMAVAINKVFNKKDPRDEEPTPATDGDDGYSS